MSSHSKRRASKRSRRKESDNDTHYAFISDFGYGPELDTRLPRSGTHSKADTKYDTYYDIAVNRTLEELEEIFKKDVNPNKIIRRDGKIIAFHAIVRGWDWEFSTRVEKVKLFLEHGMNPNLKDEKGRTPLVNLCYLGLYNSLRIPPYTRPEDVDKKLKDVEQRKYNFRTLIDLLISYGADPNIPDNKGNTCLHYCVKHDPFYFQIFEQYGADRSIRNNKGETPYDKYLSWNGWQKDVYKGYKQIFS